MAESRRRGPAPCSLAVALMTCVPVAVAAQQTVAGPAAHTRVAWRLERLWHLGGGEDASLQLATFYPKDLATDAQGQLLVIDRTESRVVVHDSAGRRVRAIGRRGAGPGELGAPLSIAVAPDASIHVYDAEKGAIVVFGPGGDARPEYRPPALRFPRLLRDGTLIGISDRARTERRLAVPRGDSLVPLFTVPLLPTRSIQGVCRITDYPVAPVFAPDLLWDVRGDLVVAAADGFAIQVFQRAAPVRTLTRATPRRRSSAALARRHLGDGVPFQFVGMPPCTIPADRILAVAEVAREIPAYERLAIAPDQRVWATRFTIPGEPAFADVFHLVNGYEATVPLGATRPVAFLSNGTLISLEADEDDVPMIVAYRVRR